jgi:hypothetical protein
MVRSMNYLLPCVFLFAFLALGGCGTNDDRKSTVGGPAKTEEEFAGPLLSRLQTNFNHSTRAANKIGNTMAHRPTQMSAGIECTPSLIRKIDQKLVIVMPKQAYKREGVFAVITPSGEMWEIYSSYNGEVEAIDLIVPSRTIDWYLASTRNRFSSVVDKFEALRPGHVKGQPLFRQPGVYQFGLMNGSDREHLEMLKTDFRVKAGCVVEFRPREQPTAAPAASPRPI